MPEGRWLIDDESEGIVERIVVTGTLALETPAHFGNGEVSVLTDMPILRDPLKGNALLTGASIAGALRNYLREVEAGYAASETKQSRVAQLFGHFRDGDQNQQIAFASLLIIDDALGEPPQTELRDGVTIDPKTRTAEEKKLYNVELLKPGTAFRLSFELLIPKGKDGSRFETEENRHSLVESLVVALHGLQTGEIGLGKRKRRGLGHCRIDNWSIKSYNLTDKDDLLAWLDEADPKNIRSGSDIRSLLHTPTLADKRETFSLEAYFSLEGSSLLIRSASDQPGDPDTIHLHSDDKPVLSGTSLAGALRARALKIVKTLKLKDPAAFINQLFGDRHEPDEKGKLPKRLRASRLIVGETEIKKGLSLVQSRVKLDRFTGGAYPGALFSEQPIFGTAQTQIKISLTLLQPQEAEIGLLLLLLKDLWTGDLTLGGEASVGRGRLSGQTATLTYGKQIWELSEQNGKIIVEGKPQKAQQTLQEFVDKLLQEREEPA